MMVQDISLCFTNLLFQRKIMGVTDERVRKTDEVLNGMKVIKFFGWETKMMEVQ